ncbi:MAG: protein phosphatase 2C domain-containing protein [Bifidobacteriaceae bacterium]|nr:protein phosphatase 2C domain-containing protein [Bifidobacteriaceae bacterium]
MTVAFRYAVRSDVGLTRANNQDSAYAGPHLLVIADGMGGHAGGDIASSVAIAHLAPLDDETPAADDAAVALDAAVEEAHQELLDRVVDDPELAGLGTTVTALLRTGDRLVLGHIGDSRAYLLRDGVMEQVTTDHTFVQFLVDSGKLDPDQAERHPQRSLLLRVLGDVDLAGGLDISVRKAEAGDRWLLCSDGLSGVVSAGTLEATLLEHPQPGACADALIDLALRGGGPDNVTCVVADVVELDDLPDGEAPSTAVQVAGAAAVDRNKPTRGGSGAAAKAASLTPKKRADDADTDLPRARFKVLRVILWLLVLLGLAAAITFGVHMFYQWTQTRFYVAQSNSVVAVYQGIPQKIGPWELSHVAEELPGIPMDSLTQAWRDRIEQTVQVDSLADGQELAERAYAESVAELTKPPKASASPTPSTGPSFGPTPSATKTASPSPSPSQTPSPSGAPSATSSAAAPEVGGGQTVPSTEPTATPSPAAEDAGDTADGTAAEG